MSDCVKDWNRGFGVGDLESAPRSMLRMLILAYSEVAYRARLAGDDARAADFEESRRFAVSVEAGRARARGGEW